MTLDVNKIIDVLDLSIHDLMIKYPQDSIETLIDEIVPFEDEQGNVDITGLVNAVNKAKGEDRQRLIDVSLSFLENTTPTCIEDKVLADFRNRVNE